MDKDKILENLLERIILDLQNVLNTTKEESLLDTLKNVINALGTIKNNKLFMTHEAILIKKLFTDHELCENLNKYIGNDALIASNENLLKTTAKITTIQEVSLQELVDFLGQIRGKKVEYKKDDELFAGSSLNKVVKLDKMTISIEFGTGIETITYIQEIIHDLNSKNIKVYGMNGKLEINYY